jgi:hypothetical protein
MDTMDTIITGIITGIGDIGGMEAAGIGIVGIAGMIGQNPHTQAPIFSLMTTVHPLLTITIAPTTTSIPTIPITKIVQRRSTLSRSKPPLAHFLHLLICKTSKLRRDLCLSYVNAFFRQFLPFLLLAQIQLLLVMAAAVEAADTWAAVEAAAIGAAAAAIGVVETGDMATGETGEIGAAGTTVAEPTFMELLSTTMTMVIQDTTIIIPSLTTMVTTVTMEMGISIITINRNCRASL